MKKSESLNIFKENLQNITQLLKTPDPIVFQAEVDQSIINIQNISQSIKQKTLLSKKSLMEKFGILWEKLKKQFEANLEKSFQNIDNELKNMDVLLLYFRHGQANIKDFDFKNSKFLNELGKANDAGFFNEKNSLEHFFTQNPQNTIFFLQKFKYFLGKTLKKAEEMTNFELELEKEFSLIMNSFDIIQEKLCMISNSSNRFEEILKDIKNLTGPGVLNNESEIQFSSKNVAELKQKKEIPTLHVPKTYKEMFSPSEISILKICHFKENFYITCGWDGKINITNALGKKTTVNFEAHSFPIRDIKRIQPNIFITTSDDCKTKIWRLENDPILVSQIDTIQDKMRCLLVRGLLCEGSLLMGGDAGFLHLYDLGLFKKEFSLKITDFGITSISSIEGTEKLIIGTGRGEIVFFDLVTKKPIKNINDAHDDWITGFSIVKKIGWIEVCSGSFDCFVKVWMFKGEKNELTLNKKVKCDGWVLKVLHFKVNVIVAGAGKNIMLIDTEKGTVIKKFDHAHETYVNDICLSNRDASILSVGQEETNSIREWSD